MEKEKKEVGRVQGRSLQIHRNNCKNDFDEYERCYIDTLYGHVCTWGSGEMGQLGHPQTLINGLPKDREGFPFQPYPLRVAQLRHSRIVDVSAGEGISNPPRPIL
jgi:hypothetical protein